MTPETKHCASINLPSVTGVVRFRAMPKLDIIVSGTIQNGILMDTRISKLAWAIGGAIIGSIVSLAVDKIVLPYFEGKPNIEVVAKHPESGQAEFTVRNSGSAEVSDLWLSARLSDIFQSRVDILTIDHSEDDISAKCQYRIVNSTFRSSGSIRHPTDLNTESASLELKCNLINPGEKWSARIGFIEIRNGYVAGLLVHVKYPGNSENLYARF